MARRSRRARRNIAKSATPKPARRRLQVRPLALVGGLVGGAGSAVLAQQYGVAALTIETLGVGVVTGLAIAVVVPSLVFAVALAVHDRRQRRSARSATALGAIASVAMLAAVMASGVRGAGASVSGPCLGEVNGTDVTELAATKAHAIDVGDGGRLRVVIRSFGVIESSRLVAKVPGRDFTVREVEAGSDLSVDPHVFAYDFAFDDSPWLGTGLQEFVAIANLGESGTCTAEFMVVADIDPLATLPGRAAAGAVLLGALLVLVSTVGSARTVGVRSLHELRRSFADLQAARSHTAAVGLPAGPPWAARAAGGTYARAPLPDREPYWRRDNSSKESTPASTSVPERARPDQELAPVIAFEPRVSQESQPDGDDAPRPGDDQAEAAGLAPILAFEPRFSDIPASDPADTPLDDGETDSPSEAGSVVEVEAQDSAGAEAEPPIRPRRRWYPWTDNRESEPEAVPESASSVPPGAAGGRVGARAVARSAASDGGGGGVLGPPTPGADLAIGDESTAALARWSNVRDDLRSVPDLERELQDVLNGLAVGLVTRGRLSAAIDRTQLRVEAEQWVERVGRPSAVLAEARSWRAPLHDEILGGLLTPSPYVTRLARRVVAPSADEHEWDLCVQEVAWPWV